MTEAKPSTAEPNDQKKKMAIMILAIGAALIGLALWLSGRKGVREQLSFDSLRRLVFGDEKGA